MKSNTRPLKLLIWNCWWLLRKNHTHLNEQERSCLRQLFVLSPQLHLAYTFREELTAIFNQAQTRSEGERRLTRWIQKVQQSGLDCYNGLIKTLRNHWHPILNYFVARVTSGFVEGLNNKIKTIKRRCYGIKKVANLFQRIWLDLEDCERFFLSTPSDPNEPKDIANSPTRGINL